MDFFAASLLSQGVRFACNQMRCSCLPRQETAPSLVGCPVGSTAHAAVEVGRVLNASRIRGHVNCVVTPFVSGGLPAAGEPDVKEKRLKGYQAGDTSFKAGLDGYNQIDLLTGTGPVARAEILYFDAGGNLNALRYKDWKLRFTIQDGDITTAHRKQPSWPKSVNLRQIRTSVLSASAKCTCAGWLTKCGAWIYRKRSFAITSSR
ncbi:hypothetical protein Pla52o_41480 [Novipirellula galeiformis]|uniref:Uncharacterized protein n=1 Tax=Novipirellula galeiformis TaxID=2528004 RepID=A0A5C6CCD9_9BACT|nr:hypothetical protein Pla52o_41480 [Novipirellula galeiformis]